MKDAPAPKLPPDVEEIVNPKKPEEAKKPEKKEEPKPTNGNGLKMEKARWKNRRRMAWGSFFMMILQTMALLYVALFTEVDMNRLKAIAEPLAWSYLGFTSVIGAYMGFTTWASKRK